MRKKLIITAALAGLTISSLTVPAAYAEEASASKDLTSSALENLGIDNVDSQLLDSISNRVNEAMSDGIIDQNIVDAVEETTEIPVADSTDASTDAPTVEPSTEPTEAPTAETTEQPSGNPVHDQMDKHLQDQGVKWEQVKADWTAAFETVRSDFDNCISAGGTSSDCAQGLGFKLQIAHAQVLLNNYDARVAEIANLPEDQQAEALAKLEEHRQRTLDRLEKAQQLLADHIANGTTLPEGTNIKNLPGEAELVNGLLQQLGSSERAIPADAKHVKKNEDGSSTITRDNGQEQTFAPQPSHSRDPEKAVEAPPAPSVTGGQPGAVNTRPSEAEQQKTTPPAQNAPNQNFRPSNAPQPPRQPEQSRQNQGNPNQESND